MERRLEVVGPCGLEPQTSCVSSRRSNQLSYGPVEYDYPNIGTFWSELGLILEVVGQHLRYRLRVLANLCGRRKLEAGLSSRLSLFYFRAARL